MTAPAPDLVVDAVLDDPGEPVPAKGEQWTIAIMRYVVEHVVEGAYAHREIHVGHDDPDPDAFQPGMRHRLYLVREFPAQATWLNPWRGAQAGEFFCVHFERRDAAPRP